MKKRHNFRELMIWERSMRLVKQVYEVTKGFTKEERFGLTNQIRRAAVSVPSNIAEGCGRGTDPQLIQYLNIDHGSLCELETQLILSKELSFLKEEPLIDLTNEINQLQKMVLKLIDKLNQWKAD
ncbi:MAG: four helix bundle protein [Bacteroidota bacterium]